MDQAKTLCFAQSELERYLSQAGWKPGSYQYSVGLLEQTNEETDTLEIRTSGTFGSICGSNARTALTAVYRFLHEYGYCWIRPGKEGEIIPDCVQLDREISICETAAYRHRGICIEGAVSYENVRDMIDYLPKAGFNAYYFQFRESYTFFEKWYSHDGNPFLTPEPFCKETARQIVCKLEDEIALRGLIYHAVGHGWTCEPFGIEGLGWDPVKVDLPEATRECLALVNGKRELWHSVPLETNLCYSQVGVRQKIAEDVVAYCRRKPEVDIIHLWLSDGRNNFCECENCRDILPSDQYILLLNEVDEALTAAGITAKIVFLIYFDLLWPPKTQKLLNRDRFILMFAPITRTYCHSFDAGKGEFQIPEYQRNHLHFPDTIEENIAFLREWQNCFDGDGFDYDYHFMWEFNLDPGQEVICRTLWQDIRNLSQIGLHGLVSCQTQRSFFPTGLGVYLMGRMLWKREFSYEEVSGGYYREAFGADGALCQDYMKQISECFDMDEINGRTPLRPEKILDQHKRLRRILDEFSPVIERNIALLSGARKKSWEFLRYHQTVVRYLAGILDALSMGEMEKAEQAWNECKADLWKHEPEIQPVLDVNLFVLTWNKRIERLKNPEIALWNEA